MIQAFPVLRYTLPLLLTGVMSGASVAQEATPQPPVATPATAPSQPFTQPTGQTPPTPRPDKAPSTDPYGVPLAGDKKTDLFNKATPGQPLPDDPTIIRTLDEALATAFRRSPQLLLSREQAVRTNATVQRIKAGGRPQITLSGSLSRLTDSGAAFGGGGGGINPTSIQNPFGTGLQSTPPGSQPVTLSGSSTAGSTQSGATGQTSATGATASGSAGTAGQSRAASGGSAAQTRAATPSGRQVTDPADPDPVDPDPNPGTGNTGNVARSGTNLTQQSASLTVSQFIDLTGIVKTAVRIGALEEALSRLEIARNRQDVAFNVRTGFYNVLRAQAFVRVNEAAVAQSQELLRVTTLQRDAGVASDFDVLRAKTQLDNNRQALISSRNQVAISRNAFANTLGIDPSTPVDPESPVIPPTPELDENALIVKAFQQRPEYAQADVTLLKATQSIRLERRGLDPFINAFASGSYNPSRAFGGEKANGSVGLTLTVPVFDGGATRAAVEVARVDERRAFIQKDQFTRGIKAEVQQAIVAIRDADERQQAAAQTVIQAREALRLANVRFRAGVDTQLSVNDAQTSLTQAETNLVNAQYDYLGALARLSRAVGDPQ